MAQCDSHLHDFQYQSRSYVDDQTAGSPIERWIREVFMLLHTSRVHKYKTPVIKDTAFDGCLSTSPHLPLRYCRHQCRNNPLPPLRCRTPQPRLCRVLQQRCLRTDRPLSEHQQDPTVVNAGKQRKNVRWILTNLFAMSIFRAITGTVQACPGYANVPTRQHFVD